MGNEWAPAVFLSIVALTTGGVVLLRPLVKSLGEYLQVLIREKRELLDARPDTDALARRMGEIEERLEFVDRLVAGSSRERPPPDDRT